MPIKETTRRRVGIDAYDDAYAICPPGSNLWLPVNRRYKPLGISSPDWVDWEPYRHRAVEFDCCPLSILNVWWTI